MKKKILLCLILFVCALIFTVLVKYVDVQAIGPENSSVGFASINGAFHKLTGVSNFWYKLTDYVGYAALLIIGIYVIDGIIQLVKRKSLLKVDKRLIALGVFYVIVLVTYVLFEKIIINYRPVLEDGVLEASYPSSHTLLALCVCGSSILVSKYLIKKEFAKILNIAAYIMIPVLVIGRLLSGYHWLTDIIGACLISGFYLMSFYTYLFTVKKKK